MQKNVTNTNFSKQVSLLGFKHKIFFSFFNNIKLLVFENSNTFKKKYLIITEEVKLKKKDLNLYLISSFKNNKSIFFSFFNVLVKFLKCYDKKYKKKLLLRGLGLKMTLIDQESNKCLLKLKLGFSHLIEVPFFQDNLSIILKKKRMIVSSNSLIFLNNFCKKIKNFKSVNVYTGRGFRFKKEKIFYKSFKKK